MRVGYMRSVCVCACVSECWRRPETVRVSASRPSVPSGSKICRQCAHPRGDGGGGGGGDGGGDGGGNGGGDGGGVGSDDGGVVVVFVSYFNVKCCVQDSSSF